MNLFRILLHVFKKVTLRQDWNLAQRTQEKFLLGQNEGRRAVPFVTVQNCCLSHACGHWSERNLKVPHTHLKLRRTWKHMKKQPQSGCADAMTCHWHSGTRLSCTRTVGSKTSKRTGAATGAHCSVHLTWRGQQIPSAPAAFCLHTA